MRKISKADVIRLDMDFFYVDSLDTININIAAKY